MPSRKVGGSVNPQMLVKVLVVDDHEVVREGLCALLGKHPDIRVLGSAADGHEAIREVRRLVPHVVLMDVTMPGMNGIEATRIILKATPETRILMFSSRSSSAVVQEALQAGAYGYLTKDSAGDELARAVRTVASGQRYFGKLVADKVFDAMRSGGGECSPLQGLSATEIELLRLVAAGKSNAKAAELLGLSPRTVETYRLRIMRKIEVRDLPALVKFAIRHGLTTVD